MRKYIEKESGEPLSRDNTLVRKLAKKTGLSFETIYRSALGDRIMSRFSAEKLSKATGGKLTVGTILGLNRKTKP